jgi:hypothetical protein
MILPQIFRTTFEKTAEDNNAWKYLAGAGTAAVGTYALARHGSTKGLSKAMLNARKNGLVRAVDLEAPKSKFQHYLNKVRYGADDLVYVNENVKVPKKPMKTNKTVLFQDPHNTEHIRSKHEIGSNKDPAIRGLDLNKRKELNVIRSLGKDATSSFINPGKSLRNTQALERMHNRFKGENYFIKPQEGFNAGPGGEGFIQGKDIARYLKNPNKVSAYIQQEVKTLLRNPTKYTIQKDMGIEKAMNGQNKEFRVHAIGNRVSVGASSPRGGNVNPMVLHETMQARKFLEQKLKKLPKKYQNTVMSADIAKTKDGYKIVELNAGSANSGFLDPEYMGYSYGNGVVGSLQQLEAARKNHALYKTITGRDTKIISGAKALAAAPVGAGVVAGGNAMYNNMMAKKTQDASSAS